jgi:TetR/AcrR family transcriptional regulator, cholesterol catabolism regulator
VNQHTDIQINIIQAALKLFMQFGFKSVTVDDIAKNLGISKKTLYQSFEDKEEIILEGLKFHLLEMEKKFVAVTKSDKNAIDQTIACMQIVETEMGAMNPVCPIDLQRYYNKAHLFLIDFSSKVMIKTLEKNIKTGIDEGYFRADLDIKFCAQFRLETELMLMHHPVYSSDKRKAIHYHREMLVQFVYGIVTLKGHKLLEKKLKQLL